MPTSVTDFHLLAQLPVPVMVLEGPQHTITFANSAILTIWNKTWEAVKNNHFFTVFPEAAPFLQQSFDAVLQTGEPFILPEVVLNDINPLMAKGIVHRVVHYAVKDTAGNTSGIMAMGQDISVEVEGREKVRQAQERLLNALDSAEVGTWSFDLVENKVYASKQLKKHFDFPEDKEFTYDAFINSVVEKDRTYVDGINREMITMKDGRDQYDLDYQINAVTAGMPRWLKAKGRVYADAAGKPVMFSGTVQDITEAKYAEDALTRSEENFRQLADLMPQIVWTAKPDGFLDYYNERWYQFTGFPKEFGDNSWLPILHPDEAQMVADIFYNSIRTGNPYQLEVRFKDHTTGEYRWFLSKAIPVRNKEGNITKWFGTSTDIHDQKTLTQQLEALVKERTQELERSNADLQQFAHVASHDLKEPVRKIRTFGNRMMVEFGADLPERAQLYLSKIETSAERMYDMIDGVLLYSSINSMDDGRAVVDLNILIHEVQTDLELLIQQNGATISVKPLPVIKGSPVLLSQLFYNLLNNALKFTHKDRPPKIEIGSSKASNKLLIWVKDNGIGFSPVQADDIFKTFTRLHSKDRYEGTGLGLALCQKIVERHGGRIWAEGEEEQGACFFVELPMPAPPFTNSKS